MNTHYNTLPVLILKKVVHRKKVVLAIIFRFNYGIKEQIKEIGGYSFSRTPKAWTIEYSEENLSTLKARLDKKVVFEEDRSLQQVVLKRYVKEKRNLSEESKTVVRNYVKYLRGKRYRKSTVKTYFTFIADFINYVKDKPLTTLTNRDVELFIEDVFEPRGMSISSQRQLISAVKLFKLFYPSCAIENMQLTRPKKSKILPTVLSMEEIVTLLRVTQNLKHRAILAMLYSAGMRIGELINLELKDIDVERKQVYIKNSKGRKDRNVLFAESLIPIFKNYVVGYGPERYFVEGIKKGTPYAAESIRSFLKASCRKAKITKSVTPHTLRHSYATHLLENGVGIRYIQELLGHAKPETTMIYTHVAKKDLLNIESPLDIALKNISRFDKTKAKHGLSRDF